MFPNGKRDGPSGPMNLFRELHACRGCADHEYASLRQLVRPAIVHRREAFDRVRDAFTNGGNTGKIASAGRQDDTSTGDFAGSRRDLVAIAGRPNRSDPGLGAHWRGGPVGIIRDEPRHFIHGHEAVRIGAFVTLAGEPRQPVGRKQTQRVPAFVSPRVGQFAALQNDVIDRTLSKDPARRKSGMTGADDDRGYPFDERLRDAAGYRRGLTATVTFVGLVRTS